ncbi:GNAT family N-acetyltransferase [Aneurinibacillus sp. REN35]|uniref:GNAT family N-acetyltransferase n=1 Tax=Aneurinibacillus sp. REN35 TaxID=3237286 RepID=UPI003529554E
MCDQKEQALWRREDGFVISTDKRHLDTEMIWRFLAEESYWASGIPRELVATAIEHSILCYGIYEGDPSTTAAKQVGFARVVSDFTRFSWLADVFVLPKYRGSGLSKWMLSLIVAHPKVKGTSFMLATNDAHGLYAQYGFAPLDKIENRMARSLDWEKVYEGHGISTRADKSSK